jgi:hypothetical protein
MGACKTPLLISGQHLNLTDILYTQMQHDPSWLETHQARVRSTPVPGQDKHHARRQPCPAYPRSTL